MGELNYRAYIETLCNSKEGIDYLKLVLLEKAKSNIDVVNYIYTLLMIADIDDDVRTDLSNFIKNNIKEGNNKDGQIKFVSGDD